MVDYPDMMVHEEVEGMLVLLVVVMEYFDNPF